MSLNVFHFCRWSSVMKNGMYRWIFFVSMISIMIFSDASPCIRVFIYVNYNCWCSFFFQIYIYTWWNAWNSLCGLGLRCPTTLKTMIDWYIQYTIYNARGKCSWAYIHTHCIIHAHTHTHALQLAISTTIYFIFLFHYNSSTYYVCYALLS